MMTNTPLFSIIIPVFNTGEWLAPCLESVLSQDFSEFEVLCVDDGSTDHSLDILQQYADRDSRLRWFTQNHKGQSAARNLALGHSKGQYIFCTDSDDLLAPGILTKMSARLEQTQAEILFFNAEPLFESPEMEQRYRADSIRLLTRKMDWPEVYTGLDLMNRMILAEDYIPAACMGIIRRDFLLSNHIQFREGIYYEDELFWFQCFSAAVRCAYLKEIGYIYRIRDRSTMTSAPDMRRLRSAYVLSLNMKDCFFQCREQLPNAEGIAKLIKWLHNRARRFYRQMEAAGTLRAESSFDDLMFDDLSWETPREKLSRAVKRILRKEPL